MDKLKVLSYNCNGMSNDIKRRQIFKYLRDKKADICLLQETHSVSNFEKIWESQWGGKIYFSHGQSNARGVCVLFRPNLTYIIHGIKRDTQGRVLCIDIEIEDIRFTLTNIYAPNDDNPDFFKNCVEMIEQFENNSKIIAGDFNLVMDLDMDKKGGLSRTHFKSRDILKTYMEEVELVDIGRERHPDIKKYTWHKLKPSPIFCRLDMVIISFDMVGFVEKSDISPSYKSDHSIIVLELELHQERRGRGFWKLNTSLFHDQEYVTAINDCITESEIKYSQENDALKLELVKMEVANCSILYAKRKAKNRKNIIETLEQRLNSLETDRDNSFSEEKQENIYSIKQEIEKIMAEKTKSSMFRSKARWYKEGEKSTKYFFSLEKSNYNKKVMKSTYLADGSKTKNPNKILKEQSNFYTKLFTSNENVNFNLQPVGLPTLNPKEKGDLEKDITIDDLFYALKESNNNKTPGCDGIPIEFYKMFWNKIKFILHNAILYAYKNNTLHISARRGVICLIPKKGKDINYIKNWRPLTLLNTDYKLLAKVLSTRLKSILHKLVNKDQTGFMKNRFIGENIRKILDIIAYTEEEDLSAILISVDFEKCFDRLEWTAIYKTMEKFNFGTKFINWVKLLYHDIYSCTTNNGYSSEWFSPTRGLRQGCPMSPYLFLLCGEIFANLVRNSQKIKGIPILDTEARISQFADDTSLFSLYDKTSLDGIIEIFGIIEENMGLRVNYDKTNIYRIGSIRNSNAKLYTQKNFKWESKPINVLGVDISHQTNVVISKNYDKVLNNIKEVVSLWENRHLSLIGKILVVNTLMGSHFVYKLSALQGPHEDQIKAFNELILKYIWNGKRPKINKDILTGKKEQGGLKLVDIEKKDMALKIQWVHRILEPDSLSAKLAYYFLPQIGPAIWQCNLLYSDVDIFMPKNTFWKEVLLAWCKLNFEQPITLNDIQNTTIWYNSDIRVANKPIFYAKCYNAGIIYISDIVKENMEFLSYNELITKFGNVMTFIEYYGILHAIPKAWKQLLKNNMPIPNQNKLTFYEKFQNKLRSTSAIYNYIIDSPYLVNESKIKWEVILQNQWIINSFAISLKKLGTLHYAEN